MTDIGDPEVVATAAVLQAAMRFVEAYEGVVQAGLQPTLAFAAVEGVILREELIPAVHRLETIVAGME